MEPSSRAPLHWPRRMAESLAARLARFARVASGRAAATARLEALLARTEDNAARALAQSEAKYRKVVENVNEGILVTAGGRILYANPRTLAMTGISEADALTTPFIEFIHPEDRERVLANHVRRLRGEPVESRYDFRVMHSDGRVRRMEISSVLFDWQGQPATLNFLSDVTERKQAEEEMRNALARERELSQLKSRFVAVASHEFRTPLAGILSAAELLDSYGGHLPLAERREIVGQIRDSATRLNGLVEQVLLASRLESGRFVFEPQPQAVKGLLAQMASELEAAAGRSERIVLDCEGMAAPRRLDAQLLRHIVINLLANALKYSPPGSPVECSAAQVGDDGGGTIVISVRDRGIGVPPEDLPLIFESFHRGHNVGSIQGSGVGLHIVRECALLHGGRVEVDSELGRGSVFRVYLHAPLAEPAQSVA